MAETLDVERDHRRVRVIREVLEKIRYTMCSPIGAEIHHYTPVTQTIDRVQHDPRLGRYTNIGMAAQHTLQQRRTGTRLRDDENQVFAEVSFRHGVAA